MEQPTTIKRKTKNDYINNIKFHDELCIYLDAVSIAIDQKKPKPQISRYIGEALIELCNRLSHRPNFNGYTRQWKEEMISDAILNCLASVDNYNPQYVHVEGKQKNPFGYFSQIAWNAFIRRIGEEKKQSYVKHKNLDSMNIFDENETIGGDNKFDNAGHNYIISSFEESKKEKERKKNVGKN
jgi:hypothetical protein